MGSRLKGKRTSRSSARDRHAWIKVAIIGVIGLSVIGLLWVLWLSDKGMEKAEDTQRRQAPASRSAPAP